MNRLTFIFWIVLFELYVESYDVIFGEGFHIADFELFFGVVDAHEVGNQCKKITFSLIDHKFDLIILSFELVADLGVDGGLSIF